MQLNDSKMPEAEVSIRLALALIEQGHAVSSVSVAIDGAQVKTGETVHFQLKEFLVENGWIPETNSERWQGIYRKDGYFPAIDIHSSAGQGDVVAKIQGGSILRVESKKGPLVKSKSSQEYPLIREAIGQLLTVEEAGPNDILAVAVPFSAKFEDLASQWRNRPLMKHSGINIVTIDRSNRIRGLEHVGI